MEIHDILDAIMEKGNNPTRIVSLVTKTFPPLLKKGRVSKSPCPWNEGVVKLAHRYGIIGCSYQSVVNRQREREGQPVNRRNQVIPFYAQSLWNGYGEHVPDSPYLVRHRERETLYLAFLPFNRDNEPAIVEEVYHDVATGETIEPELLTEYLRVPYTPQHQGVDKVVFWRTIAIENIKMIRCGEDFDVDTR
jgi:hypothetical protein